MESYEGKETNAVDIHQDFSYLLKKKNNARPSKYKSRKAKTLDVPRR